MRTAIIVMDVQESFRQLPVWAEVSNQEIVRDVDTLVQQARAEGHAVVWVMHAAPGSGTAFDPELGHVRLMEGLTPDQASRRLSKPQGMRLPAPSLRGISLRSTSCT